MKTANALLPAALLALALVACQPASDSNNVAIDEANNVAAADVESLPPSEEAADPNVVNGTNEADDAGSELPPTTLIPAQYRGRWGMNVNDCDPKRSYAAKGLMTVGDTSIRFYESTATLKEQRPAIATSFSGQFDFTGEGQTWQRVMTFTRTGDTLKRADDDGTISYERCG